MSQPHTSVPWVCHSGMVWKQGPGTHHRDGIPICRMDRETPETSPVERDENAKFIVRACNAHADLLEACTWIVHQDDDGQLEGSPHNNRMLKAARAAIAEAGTALQPNPIDRFQLEDHVGDWSVYSHTSTDGGKTYCVTNKWATDYFLPIEALSLASALSLAQALCCHAAFHQPAKGA